MDGGRSRPRAPASTAPTTRTSTADPRSESLSMPVRASSENAPSATNPSASEQSASASAASSAMRDTGFRGSIGPAAGPSACASTSTT